MNPEPVLNTALKYSVRIRNVGMDATLINPIFSRICFLIFVLRMIQIDQKMTYERSLINVFNRIFKSLRIA